jgi:hypothetical protein
MMRVFFLLSILWMGGCATTQAGRAVQTTSVGGGFVAIGGVGLVATAIVGGTAIATSSGEVRQTLVVPFAVGLGVDVALLALGALTMNAGGNDFDAAWLAVQRRALALERTSSRTSRSQQRRSPAPRQPKASIWDGGLPARQTDDEEKEDEDEEGIRPIRDLDEP